jgi:MFS family permease
MSFRNNRRDPSPPPFEAPTLQADAAGAPRSILRRLRTFDSFRFRDFRLFFAGALLSNVGSWMQLTALGWLVFDLTHRSSSLGIVNFLAGAPVFFLTVFTGVLADHVDRRWLIIATQVVLMVQAAMFGWLASTGHVTMAWVYGLSLIGGVASAFMSPAFQAMTPDLVPRESLMNAIALSSAQFNAARLVGPMAAAVVVVIFGRSQSAGVAEIFWVNAVSFLFVIWALAIIKPNQRRAEHPDGETPTQRLVAGVRYALAHRRIWTHLLTAAMLTIFGMPFTTLLPAIARDSLHLGVSGYSGLLAANGLGALVGALGVASLPSSIKRESIVRVGLTVMASGAVALSFSHSVALSAAILVVMGIAFLSCVSSINTNLQTSVPHHLRGRVMSLFVMSFMGMMPFGALAFGALGDLLTPARAVLIGALVLLAWAATLFLRPTLLSDAPTPHAE